MALGKPGKIICCDILYAPCIDLAGCDMPGLDKLAQPLGSERVDLVIICAHAFFPGCSSVRGRHATTTPRRGVSLVSHG